MKGKKLLKICTHLLFQLVIVFKIAGQPPMITSFNPTSGPVGITVTITGKNFNAAVTGNIVYFGAVRATVTSASCTSLTVTVPPGATYLPLCVLDSVTGLTGNSSRPFITIFTNPFGTGIPANFYQTKVNVPTKNFSLQVVIGDLDGDRKPDLISARPDDVSALRNISDTGEITSSSFAKEVVFSIDSGLYSGIGPNCIAIGDLDGDGKPDIVKANSDYFGTSISVLHNSSSVGNIDTASFDPKVDFTVSSLPVAIAIGDLDGDGRPDIAVANNRSNSISVLRNTSTTGSINSSSFAAKVDFATGSYGMPYAIAIADMDGDGRPDLMVTKPFFDDAPPIPHVMFFRNTSIPGNIDASSFTIAGSAGTGRAPYSMAVGDLDGDGKPEMVIGNFGDNSVSVIRNTSIPGTFSFEARVDFGTGNNPRFIAIGDLDGDGKPDMVTANKFSNTLSVFHNTSTPGILNISSFAGKVDFSTSNDTFGISIPVSVAIGDLDGDGIPELVAANNNSNTLSVLRINCNPLPVTLLNISATPALQNVKVNWQTSLELNTRYFVIERSGAEKNFYALDSVSKTGNSSSLKNYFYIDQQPLPGISYYRIKIADKDGCYEYSSVARITLNVSQKQVTVFPNPLSSNATINLTSNINTAVKLKLYDAKGRIVIDKKIPLLAGNNSFTVDMSKLYKGIYGAVISMETKPKKIKLLKI